MVPVHASGVLDFLLDRTALCVGGLWKVDIDLQLRHIELHRVAWLQVRYESWRASLWDYPDKDIWATEEVCRKRDLNVSGTKAELVARVFATAEIGIAIKLTAQERIAAAEKEKRIAATEKEKGNYS